MSGVAPPPVGVNAACFLESNGNTSFPCNAKEGIIVSLAVGAAGLALLFVVFLMRRVSENMSEECVCDVERV